MWWIITNKEGTVCQLIVQGVWLVLVSVARLTGVLFYLEESTFPFVHVGLMKLLLGTRKHDRFGNLSLLFDALQVRF